MNELRKVKEIINGMPASDGDGVQLTRIIGTPYLEMLDPFLLLDAFGSDKPQDYIGGFPAHPHRGFETVTYMIAGKMRHKDSAGNEGVIEAGGIQWMTAGKGIIHSEMPEQEQGLLAGFQLWVNLPASHKMVEPQYQENSAEEILSEQRGEHCQLKVIAGKTKNGTQGVIHTPFVDPIYWDIKLKEKGVFEDFIPIQHNAFIYIIEGEINIGDKTVHRKQLAILDEGNVIEIKANSTAHFLLIAGKPINEAVEKSGPFVMNTKQEIRQAFMDYQAGTLTH